MPQSQDIHLNNSEIHRGPIPRTAACPGKHLDACICCETCTRQAHASLAQEMHAPKLSPDARIMCAGHLGAYEHPIRSMIMSFNSCIHMESIPHHVPTRRMNAANPD